MLKQRMTARRRRYAGPLDASHEVPPTSCGAPGYADEGCPSRPLVSSTILSRDVYDLAEQVLPFRLNLVQTDRGSGTSEIDQARRDRIMLQSWRLGQSFIHRGGRPAGQITFLLRSTIHGCATWHGHELAFNELTVSGSQSEIDMASSSGFRMLAASFPEDMVNSAIESLRCQVDLDDRSSLGIMIDQGIAVDIRRSWHALFDQTRDCPDHSPAADWFSCECEDLLRQLLLACSSGLGKPDKVDERSERRLIVERALGVIDQEPGEPMSIAALCRASGTSERTLHYAFKEHFNVSPARFLKLHRLHGAYCDLRRLDSTQAKTSDIANEWGFWHLGQFAKDYRGLFGELPSETHQRALAQAGTPHREATRT